MRGVSAGDLLGGCELVLHGTTVATNALVQMRGAKVGVHHNPRPSRHPARDAGQRSGQGPARRPDPARVAAEPPATDRLSPS